MFNFYYILHCIYLIYNIQLYYRSATLTAKEKFCFLKLYIMDVRSQLVYTLGDIKFYIWYRHVSLSSR